MSVWVKVSSSGRLIRVESVRSQAKITSIFALKLDKMLDEQPHASAVSSLTQILYPLKFLIPHVFKSRTLVKMSNSPLIFNTQLCI